VVAHCTVPSNGLLRIGEEIQFEKGSWRIVGVYLARSHRGTKELRYILRGSRAPGGAPDPGSAGPPRPRATNRRNPRAGRER